MMVGVSRAWRSATALLCAALLIPGEVRLMAQTPPAAPAPKASTPAEGAPAQTAAEKPPKVRSAGELDSLVAPIALYPDPLLAQVLAASTYPLEIVQCHRWLNANAKLKGEELTKAAAKQPWDPSVQALVAFPELLKRLDEGLQWTTELGNAFLEQQTELMDAVQRMRKKAKDGGKLESSKEQKVEVRTVENKSVIVVEPSNPEVVYVPSYNPTVVYGPAPVYAYPPVSYPPYPYGAVAATAAVSFGVGVMMGAFWGGCCGGGYGWGCGWGGNNTININNNFHNRYGYANVSGGNRTNIGSGNRGQWQHNPSHRGAVPYGNRETAQRFGGGTRGSDGRTDRVGGREGGRAQASTRDIGSRDRGQADTRDLGNRDRGQAGTRDVGANRDRVGDRSIDRGSSGSDRSAFGGGGSRERAQSASDRGFSSSRSSGMSRSGSSGFRSGGGRGGGGRRR